MSRAAPAEDAEAQPLLRTGAAAPLCRSEPRVQGPEVSIKGKRNEASRVWRHSRVTPLHGVKLAQVTTLCQNGSRLCWLCHSQVKAGICSQEDGGSHPFFAAAVVGSSMAHWGPGSSVRVFSAALCLAGPQRPSTSQWLVALVRSSHHRHWDITDVLPTLVGTDPQLKVFLRPVPCLGDRALSPLRLEGSFSSPWGIFVARLLWSSVEPAKCGTGMLGLIRGPVNALPG